MKSVPTLLAFSMLWTAVLASSGCDDQGRYRLTWTFDGQQVSTAEDCSRRGVDLVRITAYDQAGAKKGSQVVRCYPASRKGPELDPGTYDLQVEGIRFDGNPFFHPGTDQQLVMAWVRGLQIEKGGVTDLSVDLAAAPECMDGVDNDADGLADSTDPGCWVTDASGIPLVDGLGRHTYNPDDDDEADATDLAR